MAATAANHRLGIPMNSQSILIEENSAVMKAISCIPLLGLIPSYIQESSLERKITNTLGAPRAIELINVKNQYKAANVIRNLLSAALTIAGIAFGILSGTLVSGAVSIVIFTGLAGLYIYEIKHNNKIITDLQSTGIRPGIRVA